MMNSYPTTPHTALDTIAIQYVLSELMKVLQCITPRKQIDARNRMDIPHGMFGLSLKMFFERRASEDIAYIDALRIICSSVLQNAKNCIVLDDIHDLISQLADGHKNGEIRRALTEIEQSTRLLHIHDDISRDLVQNTKDRVKLDEKLKAFDGEIKRKQRNLELKKDTVLDQVFEERRFTGPIEFRYIRRFKCSFQNCRTKCERKEQELSNALAGILHKHSQEIECSISVRLKLEEEIKDLKRRLSKMEEKYSTDFDGVNSMVGYTRNSIELLESRRRECAARLIMFAEEVPKLTAWLVEFEEKKNEMSRQEAQEVAKERGRKTRKGKIV